MRPLRSLSHSYHLHQPLQSVTYELLHSLSLMNRPGIDYSSLSERELIEYAQTGDTAAFGNLYEQHLDAIYRYVFYRVGNQQEAEDLTETTFIKAWEAIEKYTIGELPFVAWLYRIARNTIIDSTRKRRIETVDIDEQRQLSSPGSTIEEEIALGSHIGQVMEALAHLPEDQQEVIRLRFLSGMSHNEAAKIMGKSLANVRVLQYRALKALRLRLQE
jgi:RNA polymerase sigma-70 factor (ECF subfamily)